MSEPAAHLVPRYADGGERLWGCVNGLTDAELRWVPSVSDSAELGKWSLHQLMIHLADGELSFADRMRRVIAMDKPALLAWDEIAFCQRLYYEDQSSSDAVDIIQLVRRQMTRVLTKLAATDFERIGIHSQRGPQTLGAIIGFADWHLHHHLSFVQKKIAALKK